MKKTIVTTTFLFLLTIMGNSQNCNTLTGSQSDLCYVKQFLINSPIHDSLDESYFTYTKGLNEYHPKGKSVPWGGFYMPLYRGGIANRWKISASSFPKSTSLHTWQQIQQMSMDDIAKLSPAEKMDIYLGNTDFRITKNELKYRGPERLIINTSTVNGASRTDTVRVESWEGFCNGVRLAGALFPEPEKEIVVKSYDANSNIFVRFYPTDLKALGGATCFFPQWYSSLGENNKRQPDAGMFDVLLREVLGKQHRTFFLDVNDSEQKWNESVVGYKREIMNETIVTAATTGLPANTRKIIKIRLTLHLLGELPMSDKPTCAGIQDKTLTVPWTTEYKLYVDANNKILSGKWEKFDTQNYDHYLNYPDYVWFGGGVGVDNLDMYSNQGGNKYLSFLEVQNLIMMSAK